MFSNAFSNDDMALLRCWKPTSTCLYDKNVKVGNGASKIVLELDRWLAMSQPIKIAGDYWLLEASESIRSIVMQARAKPPILACISPALLPGFLITRWFSLGKQGIAKRARLRSLATCFYRHYGFGVSIRSSATSPLLLKVSQPVSTLSPRAIPRASFIVGFKKTIIFAYLPKNGMPAQAAPTAYAQTMHNSHLQ
ncbi:hypothetical protein [Carnimonas bestiolae]|uniref:hypothetical protein n=1 Tax=Carnimonas bestiolae TaxID=3402172 RepID=UPI003F4AF74B